MNGLITEVLRGHESTVRDFVKRFCGAAVVACVVMASAEVKAAGRIFADGFEDGTVSHWHKNGQRNLCQVVTSSVDGVAPHSGKYMAECNWNGVVAWNAPDAFSTLMQPEWNYNQEFMVRLWVRVASDCTRRVGSKLFRFFPNDGKSDEMFFDAQLQNPGGDMFISWNINGSTVPSYWGDGTPLGDGGWHKIEIYVKHNDPGATNGIIRVWQDGKMKQEMLHRVTVTPGAKWAGMYLMSNWSNNPGWEHGANNHVEWDDVEIYSDAGSGASGLMADATISSTSVSASGAGQKIDPKPPSAVLVK